MRGRIRPGQRLERADRPPVLRRGRGGAVAFGPRGQLVFGRSDAGPDVPSPYIARPGVVWIGQSVLLMPGPLARELAEKLRGLGATVTTARVTIAGTELEAFRRRRQRRSVPVSMLTDVGQLR